MSQDAINRKERSLKILQQQNIPYIEHLPTIETKENVKIRSADEIAKRAISCLITIQLACDMQNENENIAESREFMQNLLKQYNVENSLSPKEKEFFEKIPEEQAVINMIWKYEAYWVLLWALGIVDELDFPSNICDCDFAIQAVSEYDSYDSFMNQVKLRDIDEILDYVDLTYRYDWACVDARIKGNQPPQEMNSSVILERHRAFNWLVDYDENDDWDDVSTNT